MGEDSRRMVGVGAGTTDSMDMERGRRTDGGDGGGGGIKGRGKKEDTRVVWENETRKLMTMATTTTENSNHVEEKRALRITVPPRMVNVAILGLVVGTAVGMMRGGRAASLRFLAENAHRAPTTVQGWYFYKKTKNYRVMLGAVKGAGRYAAGFATFGVSLVGAEMGLERMGLGEVKHLGAAVGTTAVCCALCG